MGVPIENWMKVSEDPSDTVELISSMPLRLRTAASTRWVTWVSSSVGAAPGWVIWTIAAGNSISGSFCTSMRAKATTPARNNAAKMTSGGTGLRIDQADMLRKFMGPVPSAPRAVRG